MKATHTILDQIIEKKRERLRDAQSNMPLEALKSQIDLNSNDHTGFYEALKAPSPVPKIIAEVKKASPSAGIINGNFSLEEINKAYQANAHIAAISLITEQDHFQGSDDFLRFFAAHNANNKPLLRKDFIFDPYQIYETKLLGAHAYLLIACLFEQPELDSLIEVGQSIGIEPLVEVHTLEELESAASTKTRCIGANARDLKTFAVDTRVHDLLRRLDDLYVRVAESGIKDGDYLKQIASGCDAALIGTHFMQAADITAAIEAMV